MESYFNTAVGDFEQKQGWGDVNYVIGCINVKEHWLAIAITHQKILKFIFIILSVVIEIFGCNGGNLINYIFGCVIH